MKEIKNTEALYRVFLKTILSLGIKMNNKSPFFVKQRFLSPLLCEEIIDDLNFVYPDTDLNNRPIKTMKGNERSEDVVFNRFKILIPEIEKYYNIIHKGTEPMMFEWYAQSCEGEKPHCENSNYINKKWVRVKDRDFTCIIFLSNFQEKVPFDSDFEVRGGKLEFIQHQFGFNPQRGTLIIFPSDPHFINNTSLIEAGDLFQIRFHFITTKPYFFDPKEYQGTYKEWFKNFT